MNAVKEVIDFRKAATICGYCEQGDVSELEPMERGGVRYAERYCDRCEERLRLFPYEDPRPEPRWIAWGVPREFCRTQPEKLHQSQYREAMRWGPKPGGKGLMFVGETRAGKTRTAFEVVKRLISRGQNVVYFSAVDLAERVESLSRHGRLGEYGALIKRLKQCGVLFLDDLGKEEPTPKVRSVLFQIISDRCDWGRPLIVTTNYSGGDLVQRYGDPETALPMVERLREYCIPIAYKERLEFYDVEQEELGL